MGEASPQLVGPGVYQTASEGDFRVRSPPLQPFEGVELVDHLALGGLAHHTAVEQNQVGLFSGGRRGVAQPLQIFGDMG